MTQCEGSKSSKSNYNNYGLFKFITNELTTHPEGTTFHSIHKGTKLGSSMLIGMETARGTFSQVLLFGCEFLEAE